MACVVWWYATARLEVSGEEGGRREMMARIRSSRKKCRIHFICFAGSANAETGQANTLITS